MRKKEELEELYRLRFNKKYEYRDKVWKILCKGFFNRYISGEEKVLDLGSGRGEFINNIEAKEKISMDLNYSNKINFPEETRFIHQDASKKWPIEDNDLDVVFTSNFIEHLPDKKSVEEVMEEAYRCLKPGGRIICLGPNIRYSPGKYWDFWDHYVPISDLSLKELFRLKKFHIMESIPKFLPYSMSLGKKPPLLFVKLYLKIPFLWDFFGKQFLMVGIK